MPDGPVRKADEHFVAGRGQLQRRPSRRYDAAPMAKLVLPMPSVVIQPTALQPFGKVWQTTGALGRTPPNSSSELGMIFDKALGNALACMLGGIPVCQQTTTALVPPQPDCIELGSPKIIGGVRPQNFDVCYRPDGVRIAHDTKTLNDKKSIAKNWQNMINDIATEATTVHSRFPHALVTFIVALPSDALTAAREAALVETLERLARRIDVNDPPYLAEAIAFVAWNPSDGSTNATTPASTSPIRLENFATTIEARYVARYKGLPPHTE